MQSKGGVSKGVRQGCSRGLAAGAERTAALRFDAAVAKPGLARRVAVRTATLGRCEVGLCAMIRSHRRPIAGWTYGLSARQCRDPGGAIPQV